MTANELPPITVRGTVYWCERNKLNKYSNKYQVQLGNLSEKAVEAIEEMGIAPSNKGDDRGFFITMKSNCLLYTSPSPRDRQKSRMPSSA